MTEVNDDTAVEDACELFCRINKNLRLIRRNADGKNPVHQDEADWQEPIELPSWSSSSSTTVNDGGQTAGSNESETATAGADVGGQLEEARCVIAAQRGELERLRLHNERLAAKLRLAESEAEAATDNQQWAERTVAEFGAAVDQLRRQLAEVKSLLGQFDGNGRALVAKQTKLAQRVHRLQAALGERLRAKMDLEDEADELTQKNQQLERDAARLRERLAAVELDLAACQQLYQLEQQRADDEAASARSAAQRLDGLEAECARLLALCSEQCKVIEQSSRQQID